MTIGGAFPLINLDQDFGYRGTGTVGDLVWNDLNANGVVDGGEAGIAGVTLDLYWDLNGNGTVDPGEPLVGSTTTNGSGGYLFSGLPVDDGGGNAQFVVDVTDTAGVLVGYWHSLGTAGLNNNSQIDPYAVTLTPGAPNNLTADFGYYILPGAVGNRVWLDDLPGTNATDGNGIQDPGEPGIGNVKVTLTIVYPNATVTTVVVVTDEHGVLQLRQPVAGRGLQRRRRSGAHAHDQRQRRSAGVGQLLRHADQCAGAARSSTTRTTRPARLPSLSKGRPTRRSPTTTRPSPPTTSATPLTPTSVSLDYFESEVQGRNVQLEWATLNEADLLGFNVYRAQSQSWAVDQAERDPHRGSEPRLDARQCVPVDRSKRREWPVLVSA